MSTTLFGIKNCDTVKKARRWLETHNHPFTFHDFRADGLDASTITRWLKHLDATQLINRRSTTWKQLTDDEKALFEQEPLSEAAIRIVEQYPTLIKRPVLDHNNHISVGFKDADYSQMF